MERTIVNPARSIITNAEGKAVFVGRWTTDFNKIVYTHKLEVKRGLKVASQTVENKVYTVSQNEDGHMCTCDAGHYHTAKWRYDAVEHGVAPMVCKHVRALIDLGIFQEPPVGKKAGWKTTFVYITDNMDNLEMIDGKLCVTRSKTHGEIVEVTLVLPNSNFQTRESLRHGSDRLTDLVTG